MLQQLIELQRLIYEQVRETITAFASEGGWLALSALLPMGVLFGAAHALTPGHSKAVLATYVAGSPIGYLRSIFVSLSLSFTHVAIAVVIAVLALPLVSIALGSVGKAPALENLSRGLLGLVGVWMVWRALRNQHRHSHESEMFGFAAGLIPCPLTLFVMTLAIARGVPEAGIVFATAMMGGVALTLSAVALIAAFFRTKAAHLLEGQPPLVAASARALQALAGLILIAVALFTLVDA
jgi:nickel/cobalt exporter